ncbi:MAG: DUF1223 domain-containing protein [Gammaproteobacteria bacterium]|nr:DUF1223 domain-containing protein [Gammaproteobacteria bacterium]
MARLLLLACLLSFGAQAADSILVKSGTHQTAVLELYTSEGCSSCPPADRWMSKLTEVSSDDLDVLALGFHVDYWDYLGWRDRFADRDYSNRQRLLGANNRQGTIYTPEFFVNGREARGSQNIIGMIRAANRREAPLSLELRVSRQDDSLLLELHSPGERNTVGQVHHRYFVYENDLVTEVERGENSGRKLSHQQVVRHMSPPRNLQVDNRYEIALQSDWNPLKLGVAVLVTSPGNLHYLQAIHTPLASLLAP